MEGVEYSGHARAVLRERGIAEEWVERALSLPDHVESGNDGNAHYAKRIEEQGDRVLHVVVNPHGSKRRVVTAFFDRRMRGQK
jgi:hypothetical protein